MPVSSLHNTHGVKGTMNNYLACGVSTKAISIERKILKEGSKKHVNEQIHKGQTESHIIKKLNF